MHAEFILYVKDQQRSRDFYRIFLGMAPALDVPGMTAFNIGSCKLGLMPEDGIARIITPALPHPVSGTGVPRCALYLLVNDLEIAVDRARHAFALPVSSISDRDWGHRAAYFADPDGHVIALATRITE